MFTYPPLSHVTFGKAIPQLHQVKITLNQSFLGLWTFMPDNSFCGGYIYFAGCLTTSLTSLSPLNTSSTHHPPSCDNQKCLQTLSNIPWGKLPPSPPPLVENHFTFSEVKLSHLQILFLCFFVIGDDKLPYPS